MSPQPYKLLGSGVKRTIRLTSINREAPSSNICMYFTHWWTVHRPWRGHPQGPDLLPAETDSAWGWALYPLPFTEDKRWTNAKLQHGRHQSVLFYGAKMNGPLAGDHAPAPSRSAWKIIWDPDSALFLTGPCTWRFVCVRVHMNSHRDTPTPFPRVTACLLN